MDKLYRNILKIVLVVAIAFLNLSMDQMIEVFRAGNYHSMFEGIKCTEMLIRRRLLTVLLHDRKKYLLPA